MFRTIPGTRSAFLIAALLLALAAPAMAQRETKPDPCDTLVGAAAMVFGAAELDPKLSFQLDMPKRGPACLICLREQNRTFFVVAKVGGEIYANLETGPSSMTYPKREPQQGEIYASLTPAPPIGVMATDAAVADLNGDKTPDIMTVNAGPNGYANRVYLSVKGGPRFLWTSDAGVDARVAAFGNATAALAALATDPEAARPRLAALGRFEQRPGALAFLPEDQDCQRLAHVTLRIGGLPQGADGQRLASENSTHWIFYNVRKEAPRWVARNAEQGLNATTVDVVRIGMDGEQ